MLPTRFLELEGPIKNKGTFIFDISGPRERGKILCSGERSNMCVSYVCFVLILERRFYAYSEMQANEMTYTSKSSLDYSIFFSFFLVESYREA